MPISLGKIILAFIKSLAVFTALNVIYYLIFKTKRKHFLLITLKNKTRFWFYIFIIFLSSFYFVNSLPNFNAQFKILNFFYYSILILFSIVVIEGLSVFSFDYLIIFKKQVDFPLIFKDLIKALVYLTLILFFLGGILKINITPLITTSAIFSIILGLALQETLGNLFSGLTLHLSKPYKIGDWIKVENYEGIVERIDWRSTSIKTFSWDYITIPNSKLSKIEIHNYSTPSILHATYIEVGTHYRHSPDKIKKILTSCAKTTKGIAQDPSPIVYLTQYGDFAINYQLRFWIKDYSEILDIKAEIMEKIWYYFKREEIEIPFPIRNIYYPLQESQEEQKSKLIKTLKKIDFLKDLKEEDFKCLADKLKLKLYTKDEIIFYQGAPGDDFYIIKSGKVEIIIKNIQGEEIFKRILEKENFFGEMSILTGEPRSAEIKALEDAELLMLRKEDLKELLVNNPTLEEKISKKIARRQMRTKKHLEEFELEKITFTQEEEAEIESLSAQIFNKIRNFFSF